jgi:uncharacterized protein YjbI with pentapeptide repeats
MGVISSRISRGAGLGFDTDGRSHGRGLRLPLGAAPGFCWARRGIESSPEGWCGIGILSPDSFPALIICQPSCHEIGAVMGSLAGCHNHSVAYSDEHLSILKSGVPAWNEFVRQSGYQIHGAFGGANLAGFDLRGAVMNEADFWGADLRGANLSGGTFQRATFNDANLKDVEAIEARFISSNFVRVNLQNANLRKSHFSDANIGGDFSNADLRQANFMGASLIGVNMQACSLDEALFQNSHFFSADLTDATLRSANLESANIQQSNFTRADLTNCSVYGISVWDVNLSGAIQLNLLITPQHEPELRLDDLALAQFIYLLLNNQSIRDVIDTITSKVVLILGRFTPDRKMILDALRDELRKRSYVPVLFDFEKPASRDVTETVSTLAHLARFVIADITDPKSIPQELMRIVPALPSVPIQPLLQVSQRKYGMFEHFKRFPWVVSRSCMQIKRSYCPSSNAA